jgi:hypothetical protein
MICLVAIVGHVWHAFLGRCQVRPTSSHGDMALHATPTDFRACNRTGSSSTISLRPSLQRFLDWSTLSWSVCRVLGRRWYHSAPTMSPRFIISVRQYVKLRHHRATSRLLISGHLNAFVVVRLAPRGAQCVLRLLDITAVLNEAAQNESEIFAECDEFI